jgi:hypothetical protein
LYILSFLGNKKEIYFKESTHPHPAIRLTNFLMVLTQQCNGILKSRNLNFNINHGDMGFYALGIAEELQGFFFKDKVISNFRENITENRVEIVNYLKELLDLNSDLDNTSVNKWNFHNS